MVEKVHLEGMSTTEALVRVNIVNGAAPDDILKGFVGSLAKERINMRLFIGAKGGCGVQAMCCVADTDTIQVKRLTDSIPDCEGYAEPQGPAALVSIFPHRCDLKTVGLALMAFSDAGLPLYGLCSSLSALTFITDHARLHDVLTALQACFDFANSPSRTAG
jgi:hypothetical protein